MEFQLYKVHDVCSDLIYSSYEVNARLKVQFRLADAVARK